MPLLSSRRVSPRIVRQDELQTNPPTTRIFIRPCTAPSSDRGVAHTPLNIIPTYSVASYALAVVVGLLRNDRRQQTADGHPVRSPLHDLPDLGVNNRGMLPIPREPPMTDKNDVVIAIAASLYATRATDDAIRAEPDMDALAKEAWDLFHKLERAVEASAGGIRVDEGRRSPVERSPV